MELIILVFSVWAICKGIKSLTHAKPKASRKTVTAATTTNNSMSVLITLQEQRDLIKDMISDINASLDLCPPEKQRYTLLNRKQQLLSKLSTIENKISKLIY